MTLSSLASFFVKKGLLFVCGLGLSGPALAADILLVSNNPERLDGPMALFHYEAPVRKTVRILYHHKNVSKVPLNFVIVAKSRTTSGKMRTLLAAAGPVSDEIFAGHKAIERYWEKKVQAKTLVSLDATETSLLNVIVQPGEIVSGIFECESDVPTIFSSRVTDPAYPEASYAVMSQSVQPQLYLSPHITRQVTYVVGGVVSEILLGSMPFVEDHFSGNALKGNYGVTYTVTAVLENPDLVPRTVSLLFSPLGGIARAMIRVSGKTLYQTGNVGGNGFPAVVEVLRLTIPPKSQKRLVFESIPQSGSYYPVHFVLRSEGFSDKSVAFSDGFGVFQNDSRVVSMDVSCRTGACK
jgi:hypothetical protein